MPRVVKGIAWALAAVIFGTATVLAMTYWLPVRGLWVDLAVSRRISQKVGLPVTLVNTRIIHWSQIQFDLMTLTGRNNNVWVVSGKGRIERPIALPWDKGVLRTKITLDDFAILEDFYRSLPAIGWISGRAFNDPIFAHRIQMVLSERDQTLQAHLIRFDSVEVFLSGGVQVVGRELLKAHAFLFLPDEKFEKIPKEARSQMIRRKNQWRGVHLLLRRHSLTVIGASGPFFQAEWQ